MTLELKIHRLYHLHALSHSWQQLRHTPIATLLTVAVLSIALLLPTTLLVLLGNFKPLVQGWDRSAAISLYLKQDVSSVQAHHLVRKLIERNDVSTAVYISPEEGLHQFATASGLADAFAVLDRNPLPGLIEIKPKDKLPSTLQQLQTQLRQLPEVMNVKVDLQWVERLFAIMHLIEQFVYGLLLVLTLAILLIIGNTIRMTVQRDQAEIHVLRLIGAGNAFIRRPFLYSGGLYGLAAGVLAATVVNIFIRCLAIPVQKIALLYNSEFHLQGLNVSGILCLLTFSFCLGIVGSWLALRGHLLSAEIY